MRARRKPVQTHREAITTTGSSRCCSRLVWVLYGLSCKVYVVSCLVFGCCTRIWFGLQLLQTLF